jgi:glycosyltransferase involved in cell wall biosynthesis
VSNYPSVAVIIAIYNDIEALSLVIDSLLAQTYPPDEIIVTEDAEHVQVKTYLQELNNEKVIHLHQEDKGWRKERALNNAIKASNSDYLIFIDGDCVPFSNFVKSHLQLSEKNTALCGRRTEPGLNFSTRLRNRELSIDSFQKKYLLNYFSLSKDKVRHYDEGLYFAPNSFLFALIHTLGRKSSHIVGCNWSCYKKDLEMINGYDEDFTLPTTGEDTDIERRLLHFGIKMKSCRNAANVIHLYHKKIFNPEISKETEALMETKKDIYICNNGLKKSI